MNTFTLITFLGFTTIVAYLSYRKAKETNLHCSTGYFLGGRSLTGPYIAGSLMLTNISTEQLVGVNGQAYSDSLAVFAWSIVAVPALILMALWILPRYLKGGFTTVPQYLEDRFDKTTRQITAVLFLVAFGIVILPIVLYSGAIAMNAIFSVSAAFAISDTAALWFSIIAIGVIGSIYAIFGGLKAVAVSDTINGIGLLIGGTLVPILGIIYLGDGSFSEGLQLLLKTNPEKFSSIGDENSRVPFSTLFTGMLLVNIFYWCTNQAIIQRTLGAKNLAEGQKGVLLAGFFKLVAPVIIALPGIIAFHIFGSDLKQADLAYPMLVSKVLPDVFLGFFVAVLFGAILSTFNSVLNSASTLFSLGVYKSIFHPDADDVTLVKIGKRFGTALAIVSILVAPMIANAPGGLFDWMKRISGFFNIPILAIIVVGMASKRVPPIAAKVAIIFGVLQYTTMVYIVKTDIHFLHVFTIVFITLVSIMLVIGFMKPMKTPYIQEYSKDVDITPWKYANIVSFCLFAGCVIIYAFFAQYATSTALAYMKENLWKHLPLFIPVIIFILCYFKNSNKPKSLSKQPQAPSP